MDSNDDLMTSISSHYRALETAFAPVKALLLTVSLLLFSIKQDLANIANPGRGINDALFDGSGEQDVGIFAAGIVSNTMPRDNTWFNLRYSRDELNKLAGVADYQKRLETVFYDMLDHSSFYEWGFEFTYTGAWASTAAGIMIPDLVNKTVTFKTLKPGSFVIGEDDQGNVDTLGYRYWSEGREVLKQWPDIAPELAEKYKADPFTKVLIQHLVRPRATWDQNDKGNRNFAFESVYSISGTSTVLEVGGFKRFPYLVWRVERFHGSAYGTGPGFKFIRDGQIAQVVAETMLLVDQQAAKPAKDVAESLRDEGYSSDPDAINWIPDSLVGRASNPVHTGANRMIGVDREQRLADARKRHFHHDFFLLDVQENKIKTRAEYLGKQAATSAIIAPIMGRFTSEVLDQMWPMLFEYATQFGILPPLPEALANIGDEMQIQYQSPLRTIQKRAHGQAGIEAFTQQIGLLNQAIQSSPPEVVDSFRQADLVDILAESNGLQSVLTDKNDRKRSADNRHQAAVMQAQAQAQMQAMAAGQGQAPQ